MSNRRSLQGVRRLVVKVGSRALSDGGLRMSRARVRELATEICSVMKDGREVVLVSSGAVLAGSEQLGLSERPGDMPQKQACAAVGQGYLMQAYQEAFEAACGRKVAQVLLTRDDFRQSTRYTNAQETIGTLLKMGVVPIINENDAIATDEIKFGENDILSALVAGLIEAELLILLTDVEGFFTADPGRSGAASLIPLVELTSSPDLSSAGASDSKIGSGGMRSKVEAARTAAATGIPSIVANGLRTGTIQEILEGANVGTLFAPDTKRVTGRKHWLVFASEPQGSIVVEDRALASILDGGDLLPNAVVSTEGDFRAKDVVNLVTKSGHVFARGVTNYAALEIVWLNWRRGVQDETEPQANKYAEVVYRNEIVLLGELRMPREAASTPTEKASA